MGRILLMISKYVTIEVTASLTAPLENKLLLFPLDEAIIFIIDDETLHLP